MKILDAFYIFLGAILAFFGTFLVEFLKNRRQLKQLKKNFIIFIKLELTQISKMLEKLKTSLEYKQYYDFFIRNSLSKSINNLDYSRKDAVYLDNQSLQEKFLDLLSDISIYSSDISSLEDFYSNQRNLFIKPEEGFYQKLFKDVKELENYVIQKRNEKLTELIDLKRRVGEFIREIEEH